MSLWNKSIKEIEFGDVDTFLQTMQPENTRLDYKREKPNDLEKTIAAFANTLGGMILVGVDSDNTDNTPIWPPMHGMAQRPGIEEAVVQLARNAI